MTLAYCIVFIFRFDDLKIGTHVGTDKYGNKYFENNYYFYGRNRWVEYAPHVHMAYDGSQIPAEWFGWMHYKVSDKSQFRFKCAKIIIDLHLSVLDRFNSVFG